MRDGIVPSLYGYEVGQSGGGDIFAWFAEHLVPREYFDVAAAGLDIQVYLEQATAKQQPGESGWIA